jgi:hypothetical protein
LTSIDIDPPVILCNTVGVNAPEVFLSWRRDSELTHYINNECADACSGDPELFEALRRECWLYLSMLPWRTAGPALLKTVDRAIQNRLNGDGWEQFFWLFSMLKG